MTSLIHFFAQSSLKFLCTTDRKNQHHKHYKYLFYETFKKDFIKYNKIAYVKRYGQFTSHPDSTMTERRNPRFMINQNANYMMNLGFKNFEHHNMKNLLPEGSMTIMGDRTEIFRNCMQENLNKRLDYGKNSYIRMMKITNNLKLKFRKKEGKLQLYSHTYEWHDAYGNDYKYIRRSDATLMKFHPKLEYYFSGGGHSNRTLPNKMVDEPKNYSVISIPKQFRQETYSIGNNCVWLSAAFLIHRFNDSKSKAMIEMINDDAHSLQWLCFLKDKKQNKVERSYNDLNTHTPKSLQDILQKYIQCNLCKIKKGKYHKLSNIEYVMKDDVKGYFIAELKGNGGQTTHVIGIDCFRREIFDCNDNEIKPLTMKNLADCCGDDVEGIESIGNMYEIKEKRSKKKK